MGGGGAKACTRVGFSKLEFSAAGIDTDTLIFVCAIRHEEVHEEGDYPPTALPKMGSGGRSIETETRGHPTHII